MIVHVGTGWAQVSGPVIRGLSYVSIGHCGVWAVTSTGAIWYRIGTYGGTDSAGTRWVQVTGSLVSISVGYNVVWGVSAIGQVFIRIGKKMLYMAFCCTSFCVWLIL